MPNEKHEWDNRSNQLNPNNDAYYQSRGWEDKKNTTITIMTMTMITDMNEKY